MTAATCFVLCPHAIPGGVSAIVFFVTGGSAGRAGAAAAFPPFGWAATTAVLVIAARPSPTANPAPRSLFAFMFLLQPAQALSLRALQSQKLGRPARQARAR